MPVTLLISGISDFNFAFVHESPSCFKPRSQWRAWGPSRFVLAVPMAHRASFPASTNLAADTSTGHRAFAAQKLVPGDGIEPPTPAFSGPRSTGELPRHRRRN